MEETKRISRNQSRSIRISLKDIPPLVPSSIPATSSLKPRTENKQIWEEKSGSQLEMVNEVEEYKTNSSFANIQIDPNSTRTVSIRPEMELAPKPQEDITQKPKDEAKTRSAKSMLHELCTAKHWKPPVYECCNVEGPSHMSLFTYKALVEVRDSSGTTLLECFGDPKCKKKTAAEHAAEAALWYLEYVEQNQTKSH